MKNDKLESGKLRNDTLESWKLKSPKVESYKVKKKVKSEEGKIKQEREMDKLQIWV